MTQFNPLSDAFIFVMQAAISSHLFWFALAIALLGAFLWNRQTDGAPAGQKGWANVCENICWIVASLMLGFALVNPYILQGNTGTSTNSQAASQGRQNKAASGPLKPLKDAHVAKITVDPATKKVTFPTLKEVDLAKEYGGSVWVVCWRDTTGYPPGDDTDWTDGEQVLEADATGHPTYQVPTTANQVRYYVLKKGDPIRAVSKFSKEIDIP